MRSLKACFPSGNTLRDAAKIPLFGTKRRQQNRSRADQKLIIKVIKGGAAMHLPCSIAHASGLSQQRQGSVPAFQPLAAQQPSAFKTYHGSDVPTGLLFFPHLKLGIIRIPTQKSISLAVAGCRPLGAALKSSCAHLATEGRCKMLFFLSLWGIWNQFHTTGSHLHYHLFACCLKVQVTPLQNCSAC